MFRLFFQVTILLMTFIVGICNAETVVRFSMQQGVTQETVDLKLFEVEKAATVNNFMSYVNDGSYNNSFMHRSIPGFILQGGGYNYDPNDVNFPAIPLVIPKKASVINDPGISNMRGTIAMARPAGQVDGATSEWFFNLADNSASLLPMDGGADAYSVFGEVLNTGMQVIDEIAALPVENLGGPFGQIPLVDYLVGAVLTSNIAKITNIKGLIRISSDYDFGIVSQGSNLQPELFIENISDQSILIGNIGNSDPAEAPFRITDLECKSSILLPGDRCVFVVSFGPTTSNQFTDSFNIEFPELGLDYIINLTGEGVAPTNEPDISQYFSSFGFRSANYGEVDVSYGAVPVSYTVNVGYQNLGQANLNISSVALITSQPDEFVLQGDCFDYSSLINAQTCNLALDFTPLSAGNKVAIIRISSDDPDEGTFDFTFKASAIAENDGVDEYIENAGPNNGDGNYDGVLDSRQSNVVSLPGINGQYLTLTSTSNIRYQNVHFADQFALPPAPDNVATSLGVLQFTVSDLKLDERVEVGIILPASISPSSYYVYGPQETTVEADWFEFNQDIASVTGAEIHSGASFISNEGNTVTGTFVKLYLANAVRGDSDFKADNEINVIGGFYIPAQDTSGQLHIVELCFLLLVIATCRLNYRYRKAEHS